MDRLKASEWLQIAETELERADRFLQQSDVVAAYCLDQAIQAALFAFLQHGGENLEADVEYEREDLIRRASSRDREIKSRNDAMRSVGHLSELARHPQRQAEGQTRKHLLRAIQASRNTAIKIIEHVRTTLLAEGE